MNAVGILVSVTLGAALLALWVDLRLGGRTPQTPRGVMLHAAVAWGAISVAVGLAAALIDPAAPQRTLLALFVLVLPSWTYGYLAMAWALKLVANALPR